MIPTRVQVWSDRKMVTLRGAVVPAPPGEPALLQGVADGLIGGVTAVKLDDGRELLIGVADLEILP